MGLTRTKLQWLYSIILLPLLLAGAWFGWNVHKSSNERSEVKRDYSIVNGIENGILSVQAWEEEVKEIILHQIEEFEFTDEQDSILERQISDVLLQVINRGDSIIQNEDATFKTKMRKWGYNLVVDKEDLERKVPAFSRSIVKDLTSEESKQRMKKIASQKLEEFSAQTYQPSEEILMPVDFYKKYEVDSKEAFNQKTEKLASDLEVLAFRYTFALIGVVVLMLLPWLLMYRRKLTSLRKPLFIFSVFLAFIVLLVGVSSVMIEIDARISKLEFVLLGEKVQFQDQILFYRSKSIIEVVQILLQTRKFDSILVGGLILAFSVVLPMAKLISTEIYLLGKEKFRKNKLIYWMALKSGKWSMADVMVVAIFMAYVGFQGILESQLEIVNMKTESVNSIATNMTSLQPGFILFVTFVLFSLILSHLVKWITPKLKDPFEN